MGTGQSLSEHALLAGHLDQPPLIEGEDAAGALTGDAGKAAPIPSVQQVLDQSWWQAAVVGQHGPGKAGDVHQAREQSAERCGLYPGVASVRVMIIHTRESRNPGADCESAPRILRTSSGWLSALGANEPRFAGRVLGLEPHLGDRSFVRSASRHVVLHRTVVPLDAEPLRRLVTYVRARTVGVIG